MRVGWMDGSWLVIFQETNISFPWEVGKIIDSSLGTAGDGICDCSQEGSCFGVDFEKD